MIRAVVTPEIVIIPAGNFLMGCDQGQENERPAHRVWLDGFGIGKFPVTNQEYKIYVDDNGAPAPPFWTESMFAHPEQPVVGVTWDEATAYCRWLCERVGKTLETHAVFSPAWPQPKAARKPDPPAPMTTTS